MSNTQKDYNYNYNYVIVGAGISGLNTAYNLCKKYPLSRICIIEATQYIGGRLHSIKYDGLIMDGGGARFNTEQHRIISLIKELGLWNKVIPIGGNSIYKPVYTNSFESNKYSSLKTKFPTIDDFILYMKKYIKDNKISRNKLLNTTIIDFAVEHFSKEYPYIKQYLLDIYPYYSELTILNAVEGINLFSNELSDKTKYFILNGGLEQIADTIYNKLKELKKTNKCKIDIYKETGLESIEKDVSRYKIHTNNSKYPIIITNNLILAIQKPSLLKIKYLTKHHNILNNIKSIQNEPLYRIYARYPLDKKTNKVWFDGLDKIVTNLPIKYIIPINYEKGVIMISYTDSKFANYWIKQVSEGTFETTLNKQLKQLFPDINIPKAKWYKHCPWNSGAGYWKKGYDRKIIMPKMIQPLGKKENIYICGENYSSHQAWVEGSLETSNIVLEAIYKNNFLEKQDLENPTHKHSLTLKTRKQKDGFIKPKSKNQTKKKEHGIIKNKEYTLEEVAKHNSKSDAWIVINNKVADITKWIPKHPGGDIIMKGVGKDASALFKSIGHDDYAKKMLKQYQIGILKK